MMRPNQEPEQTPPPLPFASANESESANSLVSDAQSQSEERESLLAVLTQQTQLSTTYSHLSGILYFCLNAYLAYSASKYLSMGLLHGHPAKLIVDFGMPFWYVSTTHRSEQPEMTLNAPLLLLLLGGGSVFAALTRRVGRKLIHTLKQCQDVRAVGLFAEALYVRDKSVRAQAAANLTRLLPRLRREDAHLLDRRHRRLLALYLGRSRWNLVLNDDELSLAILTAYASIGDGKELSVVKRLAQGKVSSAREGRVREAAQKYLDDM